ncbi:MAG: bifunctional phosphopantothenoylcysteine decarboxylase/phosphopantothenate--cysteine ligase CoaBC [Bacteroidales bacterium]|nr:bifunctional phosphopantothenoylcysteine decarboxylase/phosphopantothenate--cysteine ligase CoaBC [Bacteroidales bacterium]
MAASARLAGKHIVLGITGGIAAYKAPLIVRQLTALGAQVQCVATAHALQFVPPLALETVSHRRLYCDLFERTNEYATEHIALKDWADAVVVAPATANIIGKLAAGIADDALSTLLLATLRKPLLLCPAMNSEMWLSAPVQRNMATLRDFGVQVVGPDDGELACGATGSGRMSSPETIVEAVVRRVAGGSELAGRRVLLTAGPTRERIDAVRYVSNYSTGKMGIALAEALAMHGAAVELVAGPISLCCTHPSVVRTDVESAEEMYEACLRRFDTCDAAVLTAAVADFRPESCSPVKIKKQSPEADMQLRMVQTPDILASLGKRKRPNQLLVGFALETHNELEFAARKLQCKGLDFICLNSLRDVGAGFGHDTNRVTILDADGTIVEGHLKSKTEVAEDIVQHLIARLNALDNPPSDMGTACDPGLDHPTSEAGASPVAEP